MATRSISVVLAVVGALVVIGFVAAAFLLRGAASEESLSWGVVDLSGEWLVEPEWQGAQPFSGGLAAVRSGAGWGYVDRSGNVVIEPTFASARPFQPGGYAWVEAGERWGLMRSDGRWAIEPRFSRVTPFEDGVAAVAVDIGVRNVAGTVVRVNSFGLVLEDGSWVLEPRQGTRDAGLITDLRALQGGLAPAQHEGASWGFLAADGVWRVSPRFDDARVFSEGLSAVEQGGKWGYAKGDGTMAIGPVFRGALPFSEGIAAVRVGRHGFTDAVGNAPFNGNFIRAGSFAGGLASVREDEGWGFVDREGALVVGYQFTDVLDGGHRDGLAGVAVQAPDAGFGDRRRRWGLVDASGNWSLPPAYGGMAEPGVREGSVAVGVVSAR